MARKQTEKPIIEEKEMIDKVEETPIIEKKESENSDFITIISESRKNKKVFGLNGEEINFDENGKATLNKIQADYFLTIPDVKKV